MSVWREAVSEFSRIFGRAPQCVVRAPGRVNLIGEHTDYNEGYVMPLAIDRWAAMAVFPRTDRTVRVHSVAFDEMRSCSLDALVLSDRGGDGWFEYVKAVGWALEDAGIPCKGFDAVLTGDVPRGAGLSSSAALELAAARAFEQSSGFAWDPVHMAQIAQNAENQWVGVQCGIMDQLISACGREGHAILMDCRTLGLTQVPMPRNSVIVVLDTMTRRGLVESAYNERREECSEGAEYFGVTVLRDVSEMAFSEHKQCSGFSLSANVCNRVRHIVSENARVLRAAKVMMESRSDALGELMNESHQSLDEDFEVSSEALNQMVRCARKSRGCLGARMTGAGFGGCCVALVEAAELEAFIDAVSTAYEAESGMQPAVYACRAVDGADVLDIAHD